MAGRKVSPQNPQQVALNPWHRWAIVLELSSPVGNAKRETVAGMNIIYGHSHFCGHCKAWTWTCVLVNMCLAEI